MKTRTKFFLGILILLMAGFALPQHMVIPVRGADSSSYHPESFWYYPWGRSVTHKGVDIFAQEGTPVLAATSGIVLFRGQLSMGGNVLLILGPKWRVHYYAHLKEIDTTVLAWVHSAETIGSVGTTGNAAGKPAHLHYSMATLIPYPWRIDNDRQGWKKAFYLDPTEHW